MTTLFDHADSTLDSTCCGCCAKPIPSEEIAAYQDEAGDGSVPAWCEDCAEFGGMNG